MNQDELLGALPPLSPEEKAQNILVSQILGQGTTSKWSGGFGADSAVKDMAKILSGIGVTDIKQFGKIPILKPASIRQTAKGPVGVVDSGDYDAWDNPLTMEIPASDIVEKDGKLFGKTGEAFGNKVTGQVVPNTYSERQTGNAWGGTFAGSGNTGYRVQFGPDGTPYFYTTGASSSDIGNLAPLLAVASFIPGVAPVAMGLNAAIAAKQGDVLGALAGAAGLGGFSDVANAARMGKALQSGDPLAIALSGANMGGMTDVGGVNLGDIGKGIGAAKAIQSGDPLAMLRYGMGALPKTDGLTSSLGPGDMGEFSEGLIPGYFQPGGEGYIPPTSGATGSGYYDEITGEFIPGEGPLQGPLGPETGNIDPNQKWEYSLTKPGVWTNEQGEEIDLSYMPDRDTAMTGAELMERAGVLPGGTKAPTGAPARTSGTGNLGNAIAGVAGALGAGTAGAAGASNMAKQQSSNTDLLNFLSSQDKGADIKSFKEILGEDLFGGKYVPPSAGGAQSEESADYGREDDSGTASQNEGDGLFYGGGHVDDFDVDALLQILRG